MGVGKDIGLRLILNKQVGNHKWKLFHHVRISKFLFFFFAPLLKLLLYCSNTSL